MENNEKAVLKINLLEMILHVMYYEINALHLLNNPMKETSVWTD